jgi:hypothetical protein
MCQRLGCVLNICGLIPVSEQPWVGGGICAPVLWVKTLMLREVVTYPRSHSPTMGLTPKPVLLEQRKS